MIDGGGVIGGAAETQPTAPNPQGWPVARALPSFAPGGVGHGARGAGLLLRATSDKRWMDALSAAKRPGWMRGCTKHMQRGPAALHAHPTNARGQTGQQALPPPRLRGHLGTLGY